MGLPRIDIEYKNGGLGLVAPSDDRVVALVVNGVPDRPLQIFSPADAASHATSANASYATEYNRQIADFYKVAGEGAELWVLSVSPTKSTAALFTENIIGDMLMVAGGRINVVGISRYVAVDDTVTLVDDLDGDTLNAMDEAQACGVDFASRHMPVRFILDGRHFTGTTTTLRNLRTHTYNRVGVCVASNLLGAKNACIGLLLGRIANIPVNRNIGRVKDGSVPTSEAFLTSLETVKQFGNKAGALHDKGFIFLRQLPNKAGFYWNDDPMAASLTDDYNNLANGRVIDKAARIAFATFADELLDTVLVDERGKVLKTTLKQYQAKIERAIDLSMTTNEEISNVEAFIDPNQDILATSKLVVDLRITPTGTNRVIVIKIGLFNPNTVV